MSGFLLRPGLPGDDDERRQRLLAFLEDAVSMDELQDALTMSYARFPTDWARLVPDAQACEAAAQRHGHRNVADLVLVLILRRPQVLEHAERLNLTRHPAFIDAVARLEVVRWT